MAYAQEYIKYFGTNSSTILLSVITIILVLLAQWIYRFIKFFIKIRKISAVVNQLPGREGHWFWGHIFLYPGPGEKGIAWTMELLEKFPKYHRFYVGWWRPSVSLKHPDCIKVLLKTTEPKSMSGGGGYRYISILAN